MIIKYQLTKMAQPRNEEEQKILILANNYIISQNQEEKKNFLQNLLNSLVNYLVYELDAKREFTIENVNFGIRIVVEYNHQNENNSESILTSIYLNGEQIEPSILSNSFRKRKM